MKKLYTLALLTVSLHSVIHSHTIKLDNSLLHSIDGKNIGINGETVALIKKYQSNIIDILMGKRTPDGRAGWYEFEGKLYTAQELREQEDALGKTRSPQQSALLQQLIMQIRNDFETISADFREIARSSRAMMLFLIEESCTKRGRGNDSLILVLARSKEDEEVLFDRHIKTVKDLETFMTDLYNFLGDLINSCPKAQAQFKDRVEKFTKIKKLLPTFNMSQQDEARFLRFIQAKLNDLSATQITNQTIQDLYSTFKTS